MEVLHIANDFSGSKVYNKLFTEIDKLGCIQTVYSAIRSASLIGKNEISYTNIASKTIYSNILNRYDRLNFYHKIKKTVRDAESKIDVKTLSLVHAHTWYSDGAVAYELFRKYNIPYIVTVRNTDLNVFYKYMLHLRKYGEKILMNAKQIVFISDVYKERFTTTSLYLRHSFELQNKMTILYNGIDQFWIDNVKDRKILDHKNPFKLLYIGKFDKGKNVLRLIEAVHNLNKANNDAFSLTLIGGGGSQNDEIVQKVEQLDFVHFPGPIYDKDKLMHYFVSHDLFAMPSQAETFGLVYLEALSQGIPILNTVNEGIYGMYSNIGESVVYNDVDSISKGIRTVRDNYNDYGFVPSKIVSNHHWSQIAEEYLCYYQKYSKV